MISQSSERRDVPDFEMLDAKKASALKNLISNPHFRRRVSVEEHRAQKNTADFCEEGRLLTRSMTIFEQPELVVQLKTFQIFSMFSCR